MLFNSYGFMFVFLPAAVALFFGLAPYSRRAAAASLTAASLFFYGWWNPAYLGLLVGSIAFNYGAGRLVTRGIWSRSEASRMGILTIAITCDLLLLGYYFFLGTVNSALHTSYSLGEIVLPLGISFFTFTQIAFLVDAYRGVAKEFNFIHYGLFVSYFPHLIAGPVLHHKEIMPQFNKPETYRLDPANVAVGITWFAIGLFKKVVLADGIADYANWIFSEGAKGHVLTMFGAWGGALAYSLQLYFDFSGYSDMAIGISRLFGVNLPLNFASPYRAGNIIEFWRRWHITLSRFLRDYLYFPLGGNRKGRVRRYVNLLATMLLGGLWHGAGWTFVIWGGLHGIYLIVNHAWHGVVKVFGGDPSRGGLAGRLVGTAVTFVAVVVGWVVFRAPNLHTAVNVLKPMMGLEFASAKHAYWYVAASVRQIGPRDIAELGWLGAGLALVWVAPNTQQLMRRFYVAAGSSAPPEQLTSYVTWTPSTRWAVFVGAILALSLLSLTRVSEFLYFQF